MYVNCEIHLLLLKVDFYFTY